MSGVRVWQYSIQREQLAYRAQRQEARPHRPALLRPTRQLALVNLLRTFFSALGLAAALGGILTVCGRAGRGRGGVFRRS